MFNCVIEQGASYVVIIYYYFYYGCKLWRIDLWNKVCFIISLGCKLLYFWSHYDLPTRKLWTSFALFRLDSKLIEGPRQLLPGHLKTGEKIMILVTSASHYHAVANIVSNWLTRNNPKLFTVHYHRLNISKFRKKVGFATIAIYYRYNK